MDVVVVDTNVFVLAAMKADTAPRQMLRLCLEGMIKPQMGNALFAEYEAFYRGSHCSPLRR